MTSPLVFVYQFKISATVLVWCLPLILFPATVIEGLGFPPQKDYMFIRMLGWAYLALCVGYYYGLDAAKKGKRLMPTIYVGIVSNAGACAYLVYFGALGTWDTWTLQIQIIAWGSALATALITVGLIWFGLFGNEDAWEI